MDAPAGDEVGALHVLAGRQPWVIGRASTHTVLLRLRDGAVAVNRLLWSEGLFLFPQDIPVTFFFATADHFNKAWCNLLEMPTFNGLGPKRERVHG